MEVIKRKTNCIKIPKANEEKKRIEKSTEDNKKITPEILETPSQKWFTLHLEIDLISWILFGIALLSRLYRLDQPRSVVFDELHFVKHVAMYIRRIFYFDTHPPFGKQLIAAAAFIAGYDGSNRPDKIGADYAASVPVWALRIVPAIFGSFIAPLAYHTSRAVGSSRWAAALAGFLFIVDSAWLVQSRFVLMEPMLMTFSLLGLLAVLRADRNQREIIRCFWLSAAGISFACASAIKQAGLLSTILGVWISFRQGWKLMGDRDKSGKLIATILTARTLFATLAFMTTYLTIWWCHMTVLIRAGPHDHVMTSAFQASLEGGLASITRGQPLLVAHGSQVTLRHTHGRACWLHSHSQVYPIRYSDGRGSSHQQQVTCYSFKDVNNWWIVKRPGVESLRVPGGEGSIDIIKHGDVIELVHGMTSRALNSHDVAAPVSPQMQEVSCYIDYNVSMPAQALWRVEILNGDSSGSDGAWHAIQSQVRLIHVTTNQALRYTGRQLPPWAFNQHEIATSQELTHDHAVWNVEEHRYTRWEDPKDRERDLLRAEMIPTEPSRLSFWSKWRELEYKMWMGGSTSNPGNTHAYASEPWDWPLMYRPLAYWLASSSNAQIHLIGNIVVWWTGTLMALLYIIILIGQLGRRQRGFFDISETAWQSFLQPGRVFLIGWAINWFPYFLTERTLFLHHYLPASVYKSLLLAACIDHLNRFIWSSNPPYRRWLIIVFRVTLFVWCSLVLYVFRKFSVFAYGHQPLSASQIMSLRWRDSWDFIIHR